MKRVGFYATLIFVLPLFVYAYTSPGKPQGFVNDFAGIISEEQRAVLEQKISAFSAQTTIQIAVVTIPALSDETIESYAIKLFEEWQIGQKEKDNGVLFLIAPTDREVRIEVGYGLEGVLTDAQSNGIIQKIILPAFKSGNLEEGIVSGTDAIISVVKSEADYSQPVESSEGDWSAFIIIGWIIIILLANILGITKSWWLGGVIGGIAGIIMGIFFGIITGIILTVILIPIGLLFDFIVSKHTRRGRGGFWGGFGGGGSSGGGGFGGFGGGGSGGGGSSGSW